MTTILISAVIGLVFGLLFGKDKPEKKSGWTPRYSPQKHVFNRERKSRKRTDSPGWGTPHGF